MRKQYYPKKTQITIIWNLNDTKTNSFEYIKDPKKTMSIRCCTYLLMNVAEDLK